MGPGEVESALALVFKGVFTIHELISWASQTELFGVEATGDWAEPGCYAVECTRLFDVRRVAFGACFGLQPRAGPGGGSRNA